MKRWKVTYISDGVFNTWIGSGDKAEAEKMAASLRMLRHIKDVKVVEVSQ